MFTAEQKQQIGATVRVVQIIVAGLMGGVIAFLLITLWIRQEPADAAPFLAYLAVAFALGAIAGSVIVPRFIPSELAQSLGQDDRLQTNRSDEHSLQSQELAGLLATYQTRTIVACALLEGAAFFGLVTYLIEGQMLSLAVAAVLLALIAVRFPTQNRVEDWITQHQEPRD